MCIRDPLIKALNITSALKFNVGPELSILITLAPGLEGIKWIPNQVQWGADHNLVIVWEFWSRLYKMNTLWSNNDRWIIKEIFSNAKILSIQNRQEQLDLRPGKAQLIVLGYNNDLLLNSKLYWFFFL